MTNTRLSHPGLGARITRRSSRQTFFIIRLLVDRDRVDDAFRAYAYFRWMDDYLDQVECPQQERLAFLHRQKTLLQTCEENGKLPALSAEEAMLVDLMHLDPNTSAGLRLYIHAMMAVMEFDTYRRGRFIHQVELDAYTRDLAVAVTEALHYFIGHTCQPPQCTNRYAAATAAHIVHMLRDTLEDARLGYYNLPAEVIEVAQISPFDVHSVAYRHWVKERVALARDCFHLGRAYLAQVESLRCRLAGYLYIHRFEHVLDCITRDGYLLRTHYPEPATLHQVLVLLASALWQAVLHPHVLPLTH